MNIRECLLTAKNKNKKSCLKLKMIYNTDQMNPVNCIMLKQIV